MATTSSSTPAAQAKDTDQTYTQMDWEDIDSIGAHCAFCRQKDFLPFRCESCHKKFCLDHRTETSHYCENKGAYLDARRKLNAKGTAGSAKPSIYTHDIQCADPKCKSLIDTPLVMGVGCDQCNRRYCSKHRLPEEHDCKNLKPIGARTGAATIEAQRKAAMGALDKIRLWGKEKKTAMAAAQVPERMRSAAAVDKKREAAKLSELKSEARKTGDAKIPEDQRVYVYLLGAGDASSTASDKWPKAKVFYAKEWTAGRALDSVAKSLKMVNNNNRTSDEAMKLKIFHIKKQAVAGKVLATDKTLASQGVELGDTLVMYKGIAPPPLEVVQPVMEL